MLRSLVLLSAPALAKADALKCLQEKCDITYKACDILPACKSSAIDCMSKCSDDDCQNQCMTDAASKFSAKGELPGPTLAALISLDMCGGYNNCFNFGLSEPRMKLSEEPCCNKECKAPLEKYFSTDAPHGFCGEACMDPAKFDTYHRFEANLTKATSEHPCSQQWTPSNTKQYTDYYQTVTHGFPGVLTVTLDLYAPSGMPDHSCCNTPLFQSLNCVGIPGKPQPMTIFGTGPYCCPASATEELPCGKVSEPLASHYEDPKAGCQSGETSVQIQGVTGAFCSPPCGLLSRCPTDVPTGVTAKPQCALQDSSSGKKYCALICSPSSNDAQCGTNASCKSISGVGICTYDDDNTTRPELLFTPTNDVVV